MTDYDFFDADLPKKREVQRNLTEKAESGELFSGEDEEYQLEDYPELRNRVFAVDDSEPMEIPDNTDYVDSDKVAVEYSEEDSRGFLGRAYNRLRSAF